MPRVVYAMAKDGLVFRELAQISNLTNTPLKATLVLGAFTAFISFIMSLEVLVEMMSIGTLMAYTLVIHLLFGFILFNTNPIIIIKLNNIEFLMSSY